MTSHIAIRCGDKTDRTFIAELGGRVLGSSVSTLRPAPGALVHDSFVRLLDIVFSQSHVALLASVDGKDVGFVLLLDSMPDEVTMLPQAFIAYMAVDSAYERQGVATQLVAAAQDEARARGLPYLSLMVTDENLAARALYEKAGFATERRLLVKRL